MKVLMAFGGAKDSVLTHGEKQILNKLDVLANRLDRLEKSSGSQFLFSLGISFVVIALGVGVASASAGKINLPSLILVLLFGGALLIYWSPAIHR